MIDINKSKSTNTSLDNSKLKVPIKKTEKLSKINSDKNRSKSKNNNISIIQKSNKSIRSVDSPKVINARSKSTKSLRKIEESKLSLSNLETEKDKSPKNKKNVKLLTTSEEYFSTRTDIISPISYNCNFL